MMEHCADIANDFPSWQRTASEEFVNAATHGAGFALALAGAVAMMGGMPSGNSSLFVTGLITYLFCLLAVYAMSTLSHAATSYKWKTLFRQLDQGFIYLLIVGTYTPFSLAYLHGPAWMALLALMWCGGLSGFITKVFLAHRVQSVSIISYVMLAWVPIVAVPELFQVAPPSALVSILTGGFCYTLGTWFLVNDERVRHYHAVWHLCVIAGSSCHFFGIVGVASAVSG